jgi:hypothetical protein
MSDGVAAPEAKSDGACPSMSREELVDRVVEAFGLRSGAHLCRELGLARTAVSRWRANGFGPKTGLRILFLASQRGIALPEEVHAALLACGDTAQAA